MLINHYYPMHNYKLMLFFVLLYANYTFSQTNLNNTAAFALLQQHKEKLHFSNEVLNSINISASYTNAQSNATYIYAQQTINTIPVLNQVQSICIKNNEVISQKGSFYNNENAIKNCANGEPLLTASMAVNNVLVYNNLPVVLGLTPQVIESNRTEIFNPSGVSKENIEAALIWLPYDGKQVNLCWQIKLLPINTSDYWLVYVNAFTGTVEQKINLTVYCNWHKSENCTHLTGTEPTQKVLEVGSVLFTQNNKNNLATYQQPTTINDATYRVIPYPYESPQHMPGPLLYQDRVNPWLLAPTTNNATTLRWHSTDVSTNYNYTRGNNAWAQEDRDNNNIIGNADTSTTAEPYTFTRTPNYTLEPTTTVNQKFNITNLFYWNNIIHDISYQYGFDEVSGNFQENNLGRGGQGTDYVIADAQDGSGVDNANFSTPNDGGKPRMQMYLWTTPTPDLDGDVDNGIIVHEYGHGISNRFTGGPNISTCLANTEQMGEGWSDYVALMYTTNWATATVSDGTLSRSIGTYALAQPITGNGIRQYPYSTNMAVNPHTYTNIATAAIPHGIGSIWCAMLWDMTWNMIAIDGINNNLYNATATGGNSAALKLVFEGMRLQPCSPGFVDGRDAILKADTLLYNGKYSCAIWNAFARRGVGVAASQGLSSSRSDQIVDFTPKTSNYNFVPNVTQQNENGNITYTATIAAICANVTNYTITDTLPTTVTYISGGTYEPANRVVKYSNINVTTGTSQQFLFTAKVNGGVYYPTLNSLVDSVNSATIATLWTANAVSGTNNFTTSTAQLNTGSYALFVSNPSTTSQQTLTTTNAIVIPNGLTTCSFYHRYNTELNWDGAVVEITTDNGINWIDLGDNMELGAYNSVLGVGSALASRKAFTGNSGSYVFTKINLSSYVGQTIKLRFRFASDASVGGVGWYIDDIVVTSVPTIIQQSNLYNSSNVLQSKVVKNVAVLPSALPVNLLSFNGLLVQNDVQLQWVTTNELFNKMFDIERSNDGINFVKIGTIPASTAIGNIKNYAFIDVNAINIGKKYLYYRLKQIDIAGQYLYTKIIKVNISKQLQIAIAPNPATNYITINGLINNTNLQVTIVDVLGKIVKQQQVNGFNNTIDIENLQANVYFIKINDNSTIQTLKFVKY